MPFDAGQVYGVHVEAASHRRAFQIVNRGTFLRREGAEKVERPDAIIRLLLVPKAATSSDLDGAFKKLVDRGSPLIKAETGISKDEWLDDNVFRPGQETDRTVVYSLLVAQGIIPDYTLDPLPA